MNTKRDRRARYARNVTQAIAEVKRSPNFNTTDERENMDDKTFIADPHDYADEIPEAIAFMNSRERERAA